MQVRAAIAWEAGKPLSIETVDLEGPRAGEVLVELMATDICHTDAYTLSGLELLEAACAKAEIPLTLRRQPGYDHSYFFISTFMEDHLRWHAQRLG